MAVTRKQAIPGSPLLGSGGAAACGGAGFLGLNGTRSTTLGKRLGGSAGFWAAGLALPALRPWCMSRMCRVSRTPLPLTEASLSMQIKVTLAVF